MTNPSYTGLERRLNIERRAVAPREAADSPRLVSAVAVAGYGTFRPGDEKAFLEAVQKVNAATESAAGKGPRIDLDALEAAGAVRGFGKAKRQLAFTRNQQTERGEAEPVEAAHDRPVAIPGGVPLDELHPVPRRGAGPTLATEQAPRGGEQATVDPSRSRATARRGGAGRARKRS